jgi:WD40 repeat protein
MDNVVQLWSTADWSLIRTLKGHEHSVHTMALAPDESTFVTGSSDKTVKIWSFPEGRELRTLQDRKQVVSAVQISADGEWLVAGSYGGRAMVWELSGDPVIGIKASKKNLSTVAFSPDKRLLATGGLGDEISLWNLPSGVKARELTGHKVAVMTVKFIGDGRQMISLGYDQTIRTWDTGSWQETNVEATSHPSARGIIFSPGEDLAAILLEGQAEIIKVDDWSTVHKLPISVKSVGSAAFSPDGRWLAVGAADSKIRIWKMPA